MALPVPATVVPATGILAPRVPVARRAVTVRLALAALVGTVRDLVLAGSALVTVRKAGATDRLAPDMDLRRAMALRGLDTAVRKAGMARLALAALVGTVRDLVLAGTALVTGRIMTVTDRLGKGLVTDPRSLVMGLLVPVTVRLALALAPVRDPALAMVPVVPALVIALRVLAVRRADTGLLVRVVLVPVVLVSVALVMALVMARGLVLAGTVRGLDLVTVRLARVPVTVLNRALVLRGLDTVARKAGMARPVLVAPVLAGLVMVRVLAPVLLAPVLLVTARGLVPAVLVTALVLVTDRRAAATGPLALAPLAPAPAPVTTTRTLAMVQAVPATARRPALVTAPAVPATVRRQDPAVPDTRRVTVRGQMEATAPMGVTVLRQATAPSPVPSVPSAPTVPAVRADLVVPATDLVARGRMVLAVRAMVPAGLVTVPARQQVRVVRVVPAQVPLPAATGLVTVPALRLVQIPAAPVPAAVQVPAATGQARDTSSTARQAMGTARSLGSVRVRTTEMARHPVTARLSPLTRSPLTRSPAARSPAARSPAARSLVTGSPVTASLVTGSPAVAGSRRATGLRPRTRSATRLITRVPARAAPNSARLTTTTRTTRPTGRPVPAPLASAGPPARARGRSRPCRQNRPYRMRTKIRGAA